MRDALIGKAGGDLDLGTPALPEDVLALADKAGISAYPTGIDHGTITLVADGVPIQITTLRRDVETDGRHAVVAYAQSWEEDAARRDFTINALYCDERGRIYDYHDGLQDLQHRRVRFIGDARSRIREDYLRILRLFRFSSVFGNGAIEPDALIAARDESEGLERLSAERVRDEVLRILASPHAASVIAIMHREGILLRVLPTAYPERLQRFCSIETTLGETPDVIGRLLALTVEREGDAVAIANRFKLSAANTTVLEAAARSPRLSPAAPLIDARTYIFRHGADAYRRSIKFAWARSDAAPGDHDWKARLLLADRFRPPPLPVSGKDVLALGVPAGPKVGAALAAFEHWWLSENLPSDRDRAIAKLRELIAYA